MRKNTRIVISLVAAMLLCGCSSEAMMLKSDGITLYRSKNYKEAEKIFLQAISLDDDNASIYSDLGMNYIEMKDYEKAMKAFDTSIELDGGQQEAYRGKGLIYLEQKNYDAAIGEFTQAIKNTGTRVGAIDYDILSYRAQAEAAGGFYQEALSTLNALVELDVHKADSLFLRGTVYIRSGSFDKGVNDLKTCADLSSDPFLDYKIYETLAELGYAEAGVEFLNKIFESTEDTDELHLLKGKAYYLLGKYTNALPELAAPIKNNNASAVLYAGLCHENLGDYKRAESVYKSFLQTNSKGRNDADTQAIWAQCAYTQYELCDYSNAKHSISSAIAMGDHGRMDDLYWNEIMILYQLGEFQNAYDKALNYKEMFPEDTRIEAEISLLSMKIPQPENGVIE
ncbi:MAG: tetratricopeptide repeat protein [Lachnospiraceae bacterium]|nr:tetratricopeptide repeat protein [Lachnospiraceae bacterium]